MRKKYKSFAGLSHSCHVRFGWYLPRGSLLTSHRQHPSPNQEHSLTHKIPISSHSSITYSFRPYSSTHETKTKTTKGRHNPSNALVDLSVLLPLVFLWVVGPYRLAHDNNHNDHIWDPATSRSVRLEYRWGTTPTCPSYY